VVTGAVSVATRGTLNLDGGSLTVSSFANSGTLNWNSGTIAFNGAPSLSSATLTALLGTSQALTAGKTLGASNLDLGLGGLLTVSGGTLAAQGLTNSGTLVVNAGAVAASGGFTNGTSRVVQVGAGASFTVGGTITNSGQIKLTDSAAVVRSTVLTNAASGLITGTGRFIAAGFTNNGTVRATGSEHLVFDGAFPTNNLNIQLSGGTVEFTGTLTNAAGGAITGRGTLVTSSFAPGGTGLNNSGVVAFSGGFADVYGDVQNSTGGKIVTSGGGITTFYDDVVHNGAEIRTFAGSRTVFLGSQSGAGTFTGTGVVEYAGDLRPGNSPADVLYEGDVVFNSSARLFIEIGGAGPGSGYDRLTVNGLVDLGDAALNVQLINGFSPDPAGQSFTIVNNRGFAPVTGTFSGLGEGAVFGVAGRQVTISYVGGDGNDVVLSFGAVPVPEPAVMSLAAFSLAAAMKLAFRKRRPRAAKSAAGPADESNSRA
jgi:hypothetical protein